MRRRQGDKLHILKIRGLLSLGLILLAVGVFVLNRPAPETEPVMLDFVIPALQSLPAQRAIEAAPAPIPIPVPPPAYLPAFPPAPRLVGPSYAYLAQLLDFNYLTRNIILVDRDTILFPRDIDVLEFLAMDFSLEAADGPQVLIFHAHSHEDFIDSTPGDKMTHIVGVGAYLAQILEERHGISVLHHKGRYDEVNGVPMRPGSYERMEPSIRQVLADNPSIQLIIDLHRDGLPEGHIPLTRYVNGIPTAQIMFFNGLSRGYRNGVWRTHYHLHNPYQRENLAFSLQLQLAGNELYPGLLRRWYLREFRYSLHMMPRSTLVEVGTQYSTLQEAKNAMYPLAEIIAAVVG
jgi:stage II sporulation protein P